MGKEQGKLLSTDARRLALSLRTPLSVLALRQGDILFLQVKGPSLPRALPLTQKPLPASPLLLRLESKPVFLLPLCLQRRKPRQLQE